MPEPEQAMQTASVLWEAHAASIRRDDRLHAAVDRLAAANQRLSACMRAARMDKICRLCGEQSSGGCCSASVARQVDEWLLLANRLLGCEPTPQQQDFTTCCFLGAHGCLLAVKPMLCLQYDCRALLSSMDLRRLAEVQDARQSLLDAWLAVACRLGQICAADP